MARGRKPANGNAAKTPPGWKVGEDGATFELKKQPVYLREVAFGREPGKDNKQVRVCILRTMIQPFSLSVARVLGVKNELYASDGKRNPHVRMAVLSMGNGKLPFIVELYAAPDLEEPTIEVENAIVGPEVRVRVDKEGPIFSANLEIKFSYPEADELLLLAHSIGDQWFVSTTPMQTELADVNEEKPAAADPELPGTEAPAEG